MLENFKFKLNKDLWKDEHDEYLEYEAKLLNGKYMISWEIGGNVESTTYSMITLEKCLKNGSWIVI